MTPDSTFLAFLWVAALVIVSPGPDSALVVRSTLLSGRRAGVGTVAGTMCGVAAWAAAAAIGLAAILQSSAAAFAVLKFAGAACLIALGLMTLRGHHGSPAPGALSWDRLSARHAWMLGWLSASLNPKLGVFFLTLLPPFVEPGADSAMRPMLLAMLFAIIGACWLLLLVEVTARSRALTGWPWAGRLARRVTGVVLIGLGLRVAVVPD